jgi:hypothetical protein
LSRYAPITPSRSRIFLILARNRPSETHAETAGGTPQFHPSLFEMSDRAAYGGDIGGSRDLPRQIEAHQVDRHIKSMAFEM